MLYSLLFIGLKKKVFQMSLLFKENQSKFFSVLLEQLKNVKFIRCNALNNLFANHLINSFDGFFKEVVKTQRFMYMYSSIESIISFVAQGLIYLFAGISVIKENMTIGEFSIAFSYYQYICSTINYFSGLGKSYQEAFASYKRISELIEIKELNDGYLDINSIENIECKNLKFKREKNLIIDDFNYAFKKGNIYCLAGSNGIGKTTLIDLILGIYLGEFDGNIYYNEYNIKQISMHNLRFNNISVMEQFSYFFKSKVEENIFLTEVYSKLLCNKFLECYGYTSCEDFVFSHTDNNDSTLLSGGEAQKVAFLRLISKDADLMILDEPTASVDAFSKHIMMKYLKKISKEKIIIIVTHDKEVMDYCNNIIYL